MTATEVAPQSKTSRAESSVIPPIATTGLRTREQISRSRSRPSTGAAFFFRGSGKNGSDGNVVHGGRIRLQRLWQGVSRVSDNLVFCENHPRQRRRQVLLTQVDAGRAGNAGHIWPVVHDDLGVPGGELQALRQPRGSRLREPAALWRIWTSMAPPSNSAFASCTGSPKAPSATAYRRGRRIMQCRGSFGDRSCARGKLYRCRRSGSRDGPGFSDEAELKWWGPRR